VNGANVIVDCGLMLGIKMGTMGTLNGFGLVSMHSFHVACQTSLGRKVLVADSTFYQNFAGNIAQILTPAGFDLNRQPKYKFHFKMMSSG